MNRRSIDEYYMHMALSLAMRGCGKVSPNPMVGCVIVSDQGILSKGYHHYYGGIHAEIDAISSSAGPVIGTTLYVNLEPCSHQGKMPPCAPRIVAEGIKRVVVGLTDPNPLVSGKGLDILKNGGISVTEGILEKQCRWINRGFIRRNIHSRPWVTLKAAIGLDEPVNGFDHGGLAGIACQGNQRLVKRTAHIERCGGRVPTHPDDRIARIIRRNLTGRGDI